MPTLADTCPTCRHAMGSGPIHFCPPPRTAPPDAADPVATTYAEADADLARLVEVARAEGVEPACRRGCAACCTYVVSSFDVEAEPVAAAIQALLGPTRRDVISRLYAWERDWRLYAGRRDFADLATSPVWQVKRRACPMLDPADHSCLVYADRPISCRMHHALPLPADLPALPCARCGIEPPGDGCFTEPRHAGHGHANAVWQLRADMIDHWQGQMMRALAQHGRAFDVGILPLQVLAIGRARYGWKAPAKIVPLPVLRSSFPPGGRR